MFIRRAQTQGKGVATTLFTRGYLTAGPQSQPFRPRRSFLYIPGSSEKMLGKSPSTGADSVCLDLEDGVAVNAKEEARKYITKAINTYDYGKTECLVRTNPISTELGQADLEYFLRQERLPDGFVFPKLDTPADLEMIDVMLSQEESKRKLNPIPIVGLIETPTAMLNLREILKLRGASRLAAVIFGGDDYAAAAGATRTANNAELAFPRGYIHMCASAYGVQVIDIVQKNFKDTDALRRECEEAANVGYTGKQLIHPAQVSIANEVFAPNEKLVTWARRVVDADREHQSKGTGAFSLDGTMIDAPTVKLAAKIIARAEACGK